METGSVHSLFVTYIEKEGPFLKVWGQTDKSAGLAVEQLLLDATAQFETGFTIPQESLHVNQLVCAQYKDETYYRALILKTIPNGLVEVVFIDFGNRDFVHHSNVRQIDVFPPNMRALPGLAQPCIVAELHTPGGGSWNESTFLEIQDVLSYIEVQCKCVGQAAQYSLISIPEANLQEKLQSVPLQAQQAVLLSMSINMQPAIAAPNQINTYKTIHLDSLKVYPVFVSYVNDGPCHFSVQLESSMDCLGKLMTEINSVALKPLDERPIPGTICLARCEDDNNICRAVVTNEVDQQYKVFYVDFGNYEVVSLNALYQIPFKYVLPKVMAIRYSLAGVEKSTLTMEMHLAFKKFVDDRLLHLKVLPAPHRLSIPKCELWDPETETSVLDVVNRAATNAYPHVMTLNRGFTQQVKVSYVYSCNRFYVQLCNKEAELSKLMQDLQESCAQNEALDPASLTPGLPCCALYQEDQVWYRSEVIAVQSDGTVKVLYIDYGNEDVVANNLLKPVEGEQLTVLRPQAIECCLNGYQNMEPNEERDNLLEELILESMFTMKVVEMLGRKALVDLIDESNYNVASLLLDKIASQNSQVSPILVQANNRVEHRKSGGYENNRENNRVSNGRNERQPTDKPWRNGDNNFAGRNNERLSNDTKQGSWRENNRGFNNDLNRNQERGTANDRLKNRFNNERAPIKRDDWNNKSPASNDASTDTWNNSDVFNANHSQTSPDTGYKSRESRNDNGYRQRREGREVRSSSSERSFQKGPRTSTRNDRPAGRSNDSWNVSAIDMAPITAKFQCQSVEGTAAKVSISWFHTPDKFYCQILGNKIAFNKLMDNIQKTYVSRKAGNAIVGAPVVALFPEDKVFYRAHVLDVIQNQYKVYYVDFGNVSVVDSVWPIERKFMELPAQAICCQLAGILPVNGAWETPDKYSQYFDKNDFDCTFVSTSPDKLYVVLQHAGEDIAQNMIQTGLAVSSEEASPSMDITILLGQQFRATLISVNNLSDILIGLPNGIAIKCTAHNLDKATETIPENLKALLTQQIIVYVDNVYNDVLEATFYDLQGCKLAIVNPDEGAYDNVDSLCPFLVLSHDVSGYVSHVEESHVFVQPKEWADTIAQYLDCLFAHYSALEQNDPIDPDEGFNYAVLSQDGNWYRGKVLSIVDNKAQVQYLDYGNSEEVDFTALRDLDAQFLELPIMCLEIFTTVPTKDLLDKSVGAHIAFGATNWEGVVEVTSDTLQEESTEELVQKSELIEEAVDDTITAETIPEPEAVMTVQTVSTNGRTSVVVSHVDSPCDFYLQLSDSLHSIQELQKQLQEAVKTTPVLENPSAGVYCAAPFSLDQLYYRAQVLDADADITTVRFIDFGNTDVINNQQTQIKTLPPNLLVLEVHAARCSLPIKPLEEEWSTAAIDRFAELVEDGVSVQFLDQNEKTTFAELYVNNLKISEILLKENLAAAASTVVETKPMCFVSQLNSPSEFWIQLANCADELEFIAEQLSQGETFTDLEDCTPGTLCIALYPDDGMWYRARILSNTVAGIEVLFIDYGNSCISCNLKIIPEELAHTSALAQKCSLVKPDNLPEWTPDLVKQFSDIAADGLTIFTVQKVSTGETSVVKLFMHDVDIIDLLLPQTVDGSLENVQSSDDFQIVQNGELLPGKYRLKHSSWSEESESHFQATCQKGVPFQVQFLPKNFVRLFQNGRDLFAPCAKTKQTEDSLDDKTLENVDSGESTLVNEESTQSTSLANEECVKDSKSEDTDDIIEQEPSATIEQDPVKLLENSVSDPEPALVESKQDIEITDNAPVTESKDSTLYEEESTKYAKENEESSKENKPENTIVTESSESLAVTEQEPVELLEKSESNAEPVEIAPVTASAEKQEIAIKTDFTDIKEKSDLETVASAPDTESPLDSTEKQSTETPVEESIDETEISELANPVVEQSVASSIGDVVESSISPQKPEIISETHSEPSAKKTNSNTDIVVDETILESEELDKNIKPEQQASTSSQQQETVNGVDALSDGAASTSSTVPEGSTKACDSIDNYSEKSTTSEKDSIKSDDEKSAEDKNPKDN